VSNYGSKCVFIEDLLMQLIVVVCGD
jgi:hypothetical protein